MSLLDNEEGPEPVNAMDFLEEHGLEKNQAVNVLLHLLFTRTYVFPSEVREAAAELGFVLPFIPQDHSGLMH